jgi:hypothetical protein
MFISNSISFSHNISLVSSRLRFVWLSFSLCLVLVYWSESNENSAVSHSVTTSWCVQRVESGRFKGHKTSRSIDSVVHCAISYLSVTVM